MYCNKKSISARIFNYKLNLRFSTDRIRGKHKYRVQLEMSAPDSDYKRPRSYCENRSFTKCYNGRLEDSITTNGLDRSTCNDSLKEI